MPAFHRSFNPYSAAPPPPASLPYYKISPTTLEPLTNEQAGALIDTFLQSQDGKVLTLHRLPDHLLGRTQTVNEEDLEEFEHVLEEERRREGGIVQVQPDEVIDEDPVERTDEGGKVPVIAADKKRARKEERRMKKEREQEKRKRESEQVEQEAAVKKPKKEKQHKKKH
jgi:microcystin degradation protein MlrC